MKTLRFIGLQETANPKVTHPLFNDETGTTVTLKTVLDSGADFQIQNPERFASESFASPEIRTAVFNSI